MTHTNVHMYKLPRKKKKNVHTHNNNRKSLIFKERIIIIKQTNIYVKNHCLNELINKYVKNWTKQIH